MEGRKQQSNGEMEEEDGGLRAIDEAASAAQRKKDEAKGTHPHPSFGSMFVTLAPPLFLISSLVSPHPRY